MRSPAECPELWFWVNSTVLKFQPAERAAHSPSQGLAGLFQMQGTREAMKAGPQARPCVPARCAAHSLRASNFPALRKQGLLSALSQRKCISVLSVKRKVYVKEESWSPEMRLCVFMSKTLEEPLDLQPSSRDKYCRFKTGEIACLPMTGNTSLNAFILSFHKWM